MTEALKRAAEERMLLNQQRLQQNDQSANVTMRRGSRRGSKATDGYDAGKFVIQCNYSRTTDFNCLEDAFNAFLSIAIINVYVYYSI